MQQETTEVELKKPASDIEVEVEDDTPPEDRGRDPLPKDIVDELEQDELEEYSDKVKTRLKQMKKVWHDERREKERAYREQQEAIALAQKVLNENQYLKNRLSAGENSLATVATNAAEMELDSAKRAYKEAYEAGDSDKLVEAQEKLAAAQYQIQSLKNRKATLQASNFGVNNGSQQAQQAQQLVQTPRLDPKTDAWQKRNTWWGQDEEMTASALGLHQKLEKQYGPQFVGSDDYWSRIDTTMRKRFPEYFDGEEDAGEEKPASRTTKPATVVAPVTRSTSPKKIVLKQSQLALAKKLGITPEQYAREYAKVMGN
jgi:hypothetical protein